MRVQSPDAGSREENERDFAEDSASLARTKAPSTLALVDASLDTLGGMATEIASAYKGGKVARRELWEFMECDASGGRRLFRGLAGKEVNPTLERLLTGGRFDTGFNSEFSGPEARRACEEKIRAEYFREDFDPVQKVLEEAPLEVDGEWFEKSTSERDVAVDVVHAKLMEALRHNEADIRRGITSVQDVQLDLEKAAIQTSNARRKIRLARQDMVVDVLALLQMRRRRLRAAECVSIAVAAKRAVSLLVEARRRAVETGDYEAAVNLALASRDAMETEPARQLLGLNEARQRLGKICLPGLRVALDEELWRATDALEATITVDVQRISALAKASAALEEGAVLPSIDRVGTDAQAEAGQWYAGTATRPKPDSALAAALLNDSPSNPAGHFGERLCAYATARIAALAVDAFVVSADDFAKRRLVESVVALRDDVSLRLGDQLAGYADLDAPHFCAAVVRMCSATVKALDLVSKLRHYFASPVIGNGVGEHHFDDDDDEEDEEHEFTDGPPVSPTREHTHVLRRFATRAALVAGAASLWRVSWRCLSSGLRCAAPSQKRPPRVEDVVVAFCAVALLRAFGRATLVGCNNDDAVAAEDVALQEVGKAYLRSTRSAAAAVLASMLECEPWCPVRIDATAMASLTPLFALADGGNDPFAKGHDTRKDAARLIENLVADDLRAVSSDRADDLVDLCTVMQDCLTNHLEGGENSTANKLRAFVASLVRGDEPSPSMDRDDVALLGLRSRAALEVALCRCRSNNHEDEASQQNANEPLGKAASYLMTTQAACNGLGRATTRYAQIALLVEGAEDEVVDASTELFDVYARQVALAFVPRAVLRCLANPSGVRGGDEVMLQCDLAAADAVCRLAQRVFCDEDCLSEDSPGGVASSSTLLSTDGALDESVWLETITKHVVAAESLKFAARMLSSSLSAALERASASQRSAAQHRCVEALNAADQLGVIVYRTLGRRLAAASTISAAIVAIPHAWAAQTIQEDNNTYVDDCSRHLERIWTALCGADFFGGLGPRSSTLREVVWTETVQACFEAVVDGYAAVSHNCSTEGRALMSMDLQVFQFSIDKIHRARPARGAVYADSYIKAFYFAEVDLDAWIERNRDSYKQAHMRALSNAKNGATAATIVAFSSATNYKPVSNKKSSKHWEIFQRALH